MSKQERKMELTFYVAPINQGQAVEVAYAGWDGIVYKRVTDRSLKPDNPERVRYWSSKMLLSDEGDYWQTEPSNKRWKRLEYDPE